VADRRYTGFLRERYARLLGHLGDALVLVAAVILAPAACLPWFPGEGRMAAVLAGTGLGTAAVGFALRRLRGANGSGALNFAEGAMLVTLSWLAAIAAGAVPFLSLDGVGLAGAVFESTSGWTTTGLSVLAVEEAPRLILLYRSMLQFAGGAGFAVVFLGLGGPTGTGLGEAEGRGDLLVAHVRRSARLVVVLYAAYGVVGTAALRVAGMGWFDAFNHALPAVSTGGFSTRSASIGHFDSAAIEGVTVALMLLGTTNFVTAWTLLRGRAAAFARNGEIRLIALLLPLSAAVLLAGTTASLYPTLGKAARVAVFETVSALSTTGFSTVGYGDWNSLGWAVLVLLMIVGGGTGSTAGGLKQYRVYALWRGLVVEVRRLVDPGAVAEPAVWVGDRRRFLTDADLRRLGVYAFLYLGTLGMGTAALAARGHSLRDAAFEFASALGTVGLTSGISCPTTEAPTLWILTGGMFLGRLEFLVVLLAAAKAWRHMRAVLDR
jgi:trk system potassium uptake protein TrkH